MRHTYFSVLQNLFPVRVVKEYVDIDIAVAPQQINETHPESKDSYKNAILSVNFYKKNRKYFVLGNRFKNGLNVVNPHFPNAPPRGSVRNRAVKCKVIYRKCNT